MRDIRDDLQERLEDIAADEDHCRTRLADLQAQKKLLSELLDQENRKWGPERTETRKLPDLAGVICDIMSDGDEWFGGTVAEVLLKRGYDFGTGKPGRVVHFTLLGMSRRDLVESVGDGKWKLKKRRDLVEDHAA